MTSSRPSASAIAAAHEAIAEAARVALADAGDVFATLDAAEALGRVADDLRIRAAGLLAHDPRVAEDLGFASARDAVAALARVSARTAQSRLRIAAAVTENRTITGAPIPPAYPAIAEALAGGTLGVDAAELLTRELDAVRGRVEPAALHAAEDLVVALAAGEPDAGRAALPQSVEALSVEVRQVTATIDPDGACPREERAVRRRAFRLGSEDADGLIPVSGRLLPEVGGLLAALMEAHRRSPRFRDESADAAGTDATGEGAGAGIHDLDETRLTDSRTPDQRRHDTLAEIVALAATVPDAPRLDGMPVSVIVTVAAADLADDTGLEGDPIGTLSGSRFPVSRARVRRLIDGNGLRIATLTETGAVAGITSVQRCFTAAQRLAIAARDGLRCATPGCTNPHYTLQAHHVIPDREGGPTETGNGILLCYWHHRRVDDGPWEYRMRHGVPEVRAPGILAWTPLRPRHAHRDAA
jgi:hypothetical protein